MSTYPDEFKQLEEENERLKAELVTAKKNDYHSLAMSRLNLVEKYKAELAKAKEENATLKAICFRESKVLLEALER